MGTSSHAGRKKRSGGLDYLALRISEHLHRLEADREWNRLDPHYQTRTLWCSGAFRAGRYVGVRYVSYQGTTCLTGEEAERYLEGLDAGYKGRHFEYFRQQKSALQEGEIT